MKLTNAAPGAMGLQQDINRFFDRVLGAPFVGGSAFPAVEKVLETSWVPALDFAENDKEYVLRVEIPGIPKENLDVNLEGQILTVTGHREIRKEGEEETYVWREREAGRFVRAIRLPTPVMEDKIEAVSHDGLMTIRLPKLEPKIKSKITIK